MDKIEVSRDDLVALINYAIEFDDVAMNSHYAPYNIGLQKSSKSMNELVYKMMKEYNIE